MNGGAPNTTPNKYTRKRIGMTSIMHTENTNKLNN